MPAPPAPMAHMLSSRRYATFATSNRDGSLHLTPTWFLYDDGRFYMNALASDHKTRNVIARPHATVMVDSRDPGREGWIYASGPVEILTGDMSNEINARIACRYLTAGGLGDPTVGPVFEASSDITICLIPANWRSWNLHDLDEQYFGGVLASTPEKWFQPLDR